MINNITGLEAFDTGSNYHFNNEQPPARPPRDGFNLSHLHTTTIENAGLVIPIMTIRCVPGDSFDFNVSSLLRVLPQVVPPYSGQRGYIHVFKARDTDLFDYAAEYMTKGYTGTSVLQKPIMTADNMGEYWSKKIAPGDLLDYLGLPQGWSPEELTKITGGICVCPVFMYWKAVNQFYRNKNTQINDRVRLPNSFDELRLNNKSELISNKNADVSSEYPDGNLSKKVTFGSLEYRDWSADYFTSGFPSPQRGNAPTLGASASGGSSIPVSLAVDPVTGTGSFKSISSDIIMATGMKVWNPGSTSNTPADVFMPANGQYIGASPSSSLVRYLYLNKSDFLTSMKRNLGIDFVQDGTSYARGEIGLNDLDINITLDQIRRLAISQDELERMAKTDGTFAAFGQVFFGVSSKNSNDYQLQYVGGSYQKIQFSEVLQTSATTDTSFLGQYAGHGISVQTNGDCGHVDCDEHGYIMMLFSVMPDTYYHQGLAPEWTILTQDEEFLPDRERIGLVPVLNREIFFTDDESDDSTPESPRYVANELFIYQAPFDYMRFMANRISGKIADSTNKSFYPYTQAREFTETPSWNADFLKADNIRKDYLAAGNEVAYTAQFNINVRSVRPLPYFHQPAQVLN